MSKENNPQNQKEQLPPDDFDDEINLLDLLQVILNRKKMIFLITVCAIIYSVIMCLLLPKEYTATARILPPNESSSGMSGLLSQAGGVLGGLAGGFISGKSTSDLYVGILKSRTVADGLIDKFNLKELYETKYMADVYKKLAVQTSISISQKDQIISVSVEDHDPEHAADMANAYVHMLDRMNRTLNITAGQRKRSFLENRLHKVKQDLINAETSLKEFQEKYKLVAIKEQTSAVIQGAARIKGEIIMAETELEVLKQFGTERQNEAVMLKSKIVELRKQLTRLEGGLSDKVISKQTHEDNQSPDLFIPLSKMPALGMQLIRLIREAKVQEKLFELITTQYELAKIEEAKDINTIQILDIATPPDRKSGPKRRLIVMLYTVVAFFMAVFLAFFMEYIERIKTEDKERYQQIKQGLKFWK